MLSGSSEVSPEAFSRRRILLFIGQVRSSTEAGRVAVAIGKQCICCSLAFRVRVLVFIDQVRLTKGPSWHLVSAGRLCEYPRHRESTPTRSISSVKFVHRRKQDTSPLLSGSSEVSPEAFSRRRILLFIDQVRLTKGPSWHLVSAGRLCEYPRHRESTPTRSISSVKFVHRRKQDASPLLSGSSAFVAASLFACESSSSSIKFD